MKIFKEKHISIIGGAGHVGLPLGLALAVKNYKVHLIDQNENYLNLIHAKNAIIAPINDNTEVKIITLLNPFKS